MKYEVIIFDADETLYDFKKSEREAFRCAMSDLGIDYKEDYHLKVYHEINNAIWKEFELGQITQNELKVERFRRLSNALELDLDAEYLASRYVWHLGTFSFVFEGTEELLSDLSKNYKLLIITNGLTTVQDSRIRKSTIGKYFDDIIISEEVGVSKPDQAIFDYALEKLKFNDKNKVLMVGDSLTSDIKGGNNAGIDTCWFNPYHINNNSDVKATYEISDLKELYTLLN